MYNNPDWANWGLMVPYGAPYIDVNHNNIYEPAIDTPGIRGASQTIFVCLNNMAFPANTKLVKVLVVKQRQCLLRFI